MKNTIIDYVIWRGDISIKDTPYQEIDFLILSCLAYISLDELVSIKEKGPLTFKDIYQKYNQTLYNRYLLSPNESYLLFEHVAQSLRYQNIRLLSYVNEVDKELIKQFAAMTFLLEDQTLFVSYRGTDDSLIGWHEDFLMLCESRVPSQISSVDYLTQVSQYQYQGSLLDTLKNKSLGNLRQRFVKHFQLKKSLPILLGGHSKGGNLAMYAACFVDEKIQNNIKHVYNFDGPGFQDDIIQSPQYQQMLPRIVSYIPHYSFFGIVLGHEEDYHVVHSHYTGMIQHSPYSWEVTPTGFVDDELSYESVEFAIKVIMFLEKLSLQDKHLFVHHMFGLFDTLGLHTFSDLSHMSYKHILGAIKELTLLDNHVRKMLIEVLHMIWLEAKKTKKE